MKYNFFLLFFCEFGILSNRIATAGNTCIFRGTAMKTKNWIILFAVIAAACLGLSLPLFQQEQARFARITSKGETVKTVDLSIDQEFTVDGKNTITVRDGKIAVTAADCPDHYCIERGFCDSGAQIVCLPHRLVIKFVGTQEVDGAAG